MFDNPFLLMIIPIVILVILVIISSKSKNRQGGNNSTGANSSGENSSRSQANPAANSEIGKKDLEIKPFGWYYYQDDNQPAIKRTEEQQRIVDEYFIIRNYKTIRCVSKYKKISKVTGIFGSILIWAGLILAGIKLIGAGFSVSEAMDDGVGFIFGVILLVGGVVLKIVSSSYKKKFDASVKTTVAPKKEMTDEEYEALVEKKIEEMNVEQMGLEKLGLDPDQIVDIRPIVFRDKVIKENLSLISRRKDDRKIHSSTQHVTYLYFTDEQLFVYKLQFDMCCNAQEEWTSEFFYADICDISSHVSRNIIQVDKEKFEFSSVEFDIIVTNSSIGFALEGSAENIASIQGMKHKIRERKAK